MFYSFPLYINYDSHFKFILHVAESFLGILMKNEERRVTADALAHQRAIDERVAERAHAEVVRKAAVIERAAERQHELAMAQLSWSQPTLPPRQQWSQPQHQWPPATHAPKQWSSSQPISSHSYQPIPPHGRQQSSSKTASKPATASKSAPQSSETAMSPTQPVEDDTCDEKVQELHERDSSKIECDDDASKKESEDEEEGDDWVDLSHAWI